MTISELSAQLQALEAQGHGSVNVYLGRSEFEEGEYRLEDMDRVELTAYDPTLYYLPKGLPFLKLAID